jgi:hypothetical protein
MPKRLQYPRLTRRDCERMLDVHQQLNRVKDPLERANWSGGRIAAGCILGALVLVSDLYNRAEHAFLRGAELPTAPSLENGQVEIPPAAEPELVASTSESEPGK